MSGVLTLGSKYCRIPSTTLSRPASSQLHISLRGTKLLSDNDKCGQFGESPLCSLCAWGVVAVQLALVAVVDNGALSGTSVAARGFKLAKIRPFATGHSRARSLIRRPQFGHVINVIAIFLSLEKRSFVRPGREEHFANTHETSRDKVRSRLAASIFSMLKDSIAIGQGTLACSQCRICRMALCRAFRSRRSSISGRS